MTAPALAPERAPVLAPPRDGLRTVLLSVLLVSVAGRAVAPTLIELLANGRPPPGIPVEPVAFARSLATVCSLVTVGVAFTASFLDGRRTRRSGFVVAWIAYVVVVAVASVRAGYVPHSTVLVTVAALWSAHRLVSSATAGHRMVLRILVAVTGSGLAMAALVPTPASYGIDGGWFVRETRLAGPFSTPNEMGNAAGLTLVVALGLPGLSRRTRWTVVVGSVLALALTQSYTAWLATAVGVFVTGRARRRGRARPLRAAASLGALGLAAYAVVREVATSGALATASGRQLIWDHVGEHWREQRWTGHGVGYWGAAIADLELPTWAVHAHNQLLNSLFTAGLVGVGALGVALALTALAALRRRSATAAVGLGLLAYEVVRSYSEVPFELAFGGFNLFVVLAVVVLVAEDGGGASPP